MSGTEIAYAVGLSSGFWLQEPTGERMLLRAVRSYPILLRAVRYSTSVCSYVLSGTGLAYAATRCPVLKHYCCDVRYCQAVCCELCTERGSRATGCG
eukprot:3913836-Rhodomonas_salina.1